MLSNSRRLAIFVPSMRAGGAQRSMVKLACGLAERNYAVDLVLAEAYGPHLAEVIDEVRLVDLQASRVLTSLPALVRYLQREHPEAMLSVMNYANIVALWARRLSGVSTRVVVSERNTLSQSIGHEIGWHDRVMPRLIRRFYPWADGIIAVSKGVADDLATVGKLSRSNIQVVYNPIVTPQLRKMAQAPLNDPWFDPEQPPVILSVGRLRKQKDFATLIRAFAQVRQTHYARLMILGEGPERTTLETLAEDLQIANDVCLAGFVANPCAYMARASLFVLSSAWEGLPGALIEALYCGVPVISTDCPSGPREILAGGKYGQLVPVADVNALAQSMVMALTGKLPSPPPESWQPFEQDVIINQYLDALLAN